MVSLRRYFFFFLCGIVNIAFSQPMPVAKFDHALSISGQGNPRLHAAVPETLKVLAIMVEFQEDNDKRTNGNGRFDLTDTNRRIVDAAPHNRFFFQQHLAFASNYFRKVSDGKLTIVGDVLDSVYRLQRQMQYYSPERNSTNNIPIGKLMQDAWHVVDSLTPGINYQQYNAFVIFHAGVGRDVASDIKELDPTPFDIPSIYLGLPSLRSMFGDSYQGVPVADSSFFINNSIIMPETENRKVSTIIGPYLLQLGINGLLVASVASHLGLPDLFDTKTGKTAIGRFGLMDGQAIFSWNGVFPPEPSAWEKIYLGWVNPITVASGEMTVEMPAVSLSNSSDSIYKVLISSNEYFLVENRNRDANHDGATVTMIVGTDTVRKTWMYDTTNFNAYDIDSLYGSIIDIDEFDWSLPGGYNTRTGELFDGGALLWHIDEGVINANLATNTINADSKRRGVDLEEADGSQDIGRTYEFLQAGSGSEDGTQLDYWYLGNASPVRSHANFFTPTTFPNSKSNDGANSHVYLKDFSSRSPRMTMQIQIGDDNIRVMEGFPKPYLPYHGVAGITVTGNNNPNILVPGQFIYGWDASGNSLNGFYSDGALGKFTIFGNSFGIRTKPVVGDFNNNSSDDFAAAGDIRFVNDIPGSYLQSWELTDGNNDSLADKIIGSSLAPNSYLNVTGMTLSDTIFAVGFQNNALSFVSTAGNDISNFTLSASDTSDIVGISLWEHPDKFIAVARSGNVGIVTPSGVSTTKNFSSPIASSAIAGTLVPSKGKAIIVAMKNGLVHLLDESFNDWKSFPVNTNGEILNAPALADFDGDGQRDIIVFSGNKIWAINAAGAILDHFPITTPSAKTILTSPIVADLDGNGTADIIAVTQEGLVVAYDKNGLLLRGFPVLSGPNSGLTPAVFYTPSICLSCVDIGLTVASDDSTVYSWKTGTLSVGTGMPPPMPWRQYMYDAQNSGLIEDPASSNPRTNEFMPSSLAYNWPNPVGIDDGYKTHIRYFLAANANVEIKILDLAGDLVATLQGPGTGGLDNEIEWDVSGIQSGVYFAHIEARGASQSGTAIIKIAVVK